MPKLVDSHHQCCQREHRAHTHTRRQTDRQTHTHTYTRTYTRTHTHTHTMEPRRERKGRQRQGSGWFMWLVSALNLILKPNVSSIFRHRNNLSPSLSDPATRAARVRVMSVPMVPPGHGGAKRKPPPSQMKRSPSSVLAFRLREFLSSSDHPPVEIMQPNPRRDSFASTVRIAWAVNISGIWCVSLTRVVRAAPPSRMKKSAPAHLPRPKFAGQQRHAPAEICIIP